jgi:Ferritin-like domain
LTQVDLLSVAVGAYLGAAPLINDKTILSSAASIMSIEARQSSFTNSVLGYNAFSSAFETPLSIEQVVSIVSPFITSIPDGTILQALGFDTDSFALQRTSISPYQEVSLSSSMQFSYFGGEDIECPDGVNQLYCSYTVGSNSYYTQFDSNNGCQVPQDLQVANVCVFQVTTAENNDFSSCLTAPQFMMIV